MSQSKSDWPKIGPGYSLADRLAAWCEALVAIESVYGDELEIADVLERWSTSRLEIRRQGFQALKGLCMMGYYQQDQTWPALGYEGPLAPPGRVHPAYDALKAPPGTLPRGWQEGGAA